MRAVFSTKLHAPPSLADYDDHAMEWHWHGCHIQLAVHALVVMRV